MSSNQPRAPASQLALLRAENEYLRAERQLLLTQVANERARADALFIAFPPQRPRPAALPQPATQAIAAPEPEPSPVELPVASAAPPDVPSALVEMVSHDSEEVPAPTPPAPPAPPPTPPLRYRLVDRLNAAIKKAAPFAHRLVRSGLTGLRA